MFNIESGTPTAVTVISGSNGNNFHNIGCSPSKLVQKEKRKRTARILNKFVYALPSTSELKQYTGVLICGLTIWATLWFIFEEAVLPGGYAFSMAAVVVMGYIFGHTLERYTTIHPIIGMVLVGLLYRNYGPSNFLEHPSADILDFHLRRVHAVIILVRGPLGWHWEYIKNNSVKVFSLATLPWLVECLSTAIFAYIWLEYPWYWGIHLGAILASVSPAVIVPTVMSFKDRGFGIKNQVALLICNAEGLDTTFTEGMFGVINSAIFYEATPTYRIIKAVLAIFLGILLGILWGVLADLFPDHNDPYAPTVRSIHILCGGLLVSYAAPYFGWGGVSGVAIMVCASTASTRWARRGWTINENPVVEVYKLLWRISEPILFTLSGYFFEMAKITTQEFATIVGCILLALFLRMLTAFLLAVANDLSVKEGLFVAVTWMPKAVVEAVLVRVATDSVWKEGATLQDKRIAEQHSNIIVIAILIGSTLGSLLTTFLGPILLCQDSKVAPGDLSHIQQVTQTSPSSFFRRNTTISSLQCTKM